LSALALIVGGAAVLARLILILLSLIFRK